MSYNKSRSNSGSNNHKNDNNNNNNVDQQQQLPRRLSVNSNNNNNNGNSSTISNENNNVQQQQQQQQTIDMVSILSAPPPPTVRIYDPMQKHQPQQNKLFHFVNNTASSSNNGSPSPLNNSTSSLPNINNNNNNNDNNNNISNNNISSIDQNSNNSGGSQSTSSPLKSSASSSSFNRTSSEWNDKPQHIIDQELLKKILNEEDDDVDIENVNIDLNDILRDDDQDDIDDLLMMNDDDAESTADQSNSISSHSGSTLDLLQLNNNSSINNNSNSQQPVTQSSPLTLAEEREKLLSMAQAPLPMLWQSKNARKSFNGIVVEPQYYTKISEQLSSIEIRKETGFPTCFSTAKYICIGTSHGYILIFNYHQELLTWFDVVHSGSTTVAQWKSRSCVIDRSAPARKLSSSNRSIVYHCTGYQAEDSHYLCIDGGCQYSEQQDLQACLSEYQTDNDICGLEWIDSQTILILNSRDELRVFDPFALEEVESVNIKSMQLIHHSKFQNVYSFHNTFRTLKSHMYMLGMNGFFSAHILTWLERLSILVSHHQWFEALCLSLDFYEGKAKAATGLNSNTVDSKVITSDKTIEILSQLCHLVFTSSAEQIRDHSLIPKSMFHDVIDGSYPLDPAIARMNIYQQLALISIEFCIDVKRTDFLFGEVFNYYVEASMVGIFLEFLEPYILRDRLSNLNPEVMQYMMSHYQERHVLSRAEQCLLHLDIASLDFHQTVILCRKHGLYSAIIYLYNKGLDDYITPLEDMMEVFIKPNGNNSNEPTVGSSFKLVDNESKDVAYRLLLYLQYSLSGRSFPTGMIAASRVPSLKIQVLEYLFLRNLFPEDPTPYPRLYNLIKFDSTETLKILSTTFDDEFLATHDPNATLVIPPIPFNVSSSNLNHLTMFSVLLLIMIDRSQQPYDIKENEQWPFSLQQQGQLFVLLANCYKKKLFNHIDHVLMNRMIGLLAAAPLYFTTNNTNNKDDKDKDNNIFNSQERQTALLSIITTLPIEAFDYERLLVLCEGNEFYRVIQYLYSLQSNYSKMIMCQVKDPLTKSDSFNYIRELLSQPHLSDESRNIIKNTTISTLAQLIIIDSQQTAQLIMDHFAADHEKILKELSSFPKLQFTYLVGLLGGVDPKQTNSDSKSFTQRTGINISNETYELYIKLMCMFSPQAVYKYLSSHDDYPLDACLKICQQYNNFEGATYLLERTGDVPKALEMILMTLKTKIEDLLRQFSTIFANVKHIKNDKPSPQEKEVMDILNNAIALCQRNSAKLQNTENQMIWFKLLDTIVVFVRKIKLSLNHTENTNIAMQENTSILNQSIDRTTNKPKSAVYVKSTTFLNKLVHYILNNMMGYVALPLILTKIVNDHGSDEFGDFKSIISGMLDTCTFETSILNTANQLIQRDMYTTTSEYIERRSRAYSPAAARCLMCNRPLKEFNGQIHDVTPTDSVIIFQCGHSLHSTCLGKHTACPHCSSSKTKTKKVTTNKSTLNNNNNNYSSDEESASNTGQQQQQQNDPRKQMAQEKENDQKATMVYLERLNNFSKVSKRASMYNFDTSPLRNQLKGKNDNEFRDAEGYQFQSDRSTRNNRQPRR
ncbi:RING zinc finger-containing protein [Heterostelium album PN500]|uniref:RING zinc finger-containing protein n=1 Tax=Heterostelium pallidum (strain ATCC 26659 / Pp 5 / PN500) TaxID=670386 RepID=D3AZL5_HETP5|nr:RING zinc finger-containing protein [Heterostelium album PN500]EFA85394.1 RING zinc finger-containing protein [Heterostelium album PN500]|eukprot:XP_020437503.1 RING zinc finger-containing protein [Heterostelium album PN500]